MSQIHNLSGSRSGHLVTHKIPDPTASPPRSAILAGIPAGLHVERGGRGRFNHLWTSQLPAADLDGYLLTAVDGEKSRTDCGARHYCLAAIIARSAAIATAAYRPRGISIMYGNMSKQGKTQLITSSIGEQGRAAGTCGVLGRNVALARYRLMEHLTFPCGCAFEICCLTAVEKMPAWLILIYSL